MKDGEKSLTKLFDILELVADSDSGVTSKNISEYTGIPLSTVFRMLKFLVSRGYLCRISTRYYPGLAAGKFARSVSQRDNLLATAHPEMMNLAQKSLETVHLAELRGDRVCYIDKVEGYRSVRMASLIGSFSPAYCTGVGKVVLAYLPERQRELLLEKMEFVRYTDTTICNVDDLRNELEIIRRNGYAVDDCEHELGVYCLAAPVFDASGNPIAGLSISGSELYVKPNHEALANEIVSAAKHLTSLIINPKLPVNCE